MTGPTPPDSGTPDTAISRRTLLKASLAGGAALTAAPLFGGLPAYASPRSEAAGKGKLVIGAFEDGALVPFKQKIIPLFKKQTGITIQFLTSPYDSFFSKAFQDGQSKAGQYDIYIMDDPWIPQYAAAGILEDLGKHGVKGDAGFSKPFLDLGYWPPRSFDAAIGSPIGVRVSPESACFFRADGETALHRSDRASERMETVV